MSYGYTVQSVISTILEDILQARREADKYTQTIVHEYQKDPILCYFSVPRMTISKIDLTLRTLVEPIEPALPSPDNSFIFFKEKFSRKLFLEVFQAGVKIEHAEKWNTIETQISFEEDIQSFPESLLLEALENSSPALMKLTDYVRDKCFKSFQQLDPRLKKLMYPESDLPLIFGEKAEKLISLIIEELKSPLKIPKKESFKIIIDRETLSKTSENAIQTLHLELNLEDVVLNRLEQAK